MGRTEPEIERLYNLITVIDNCLENDHKSPGDYDKVKNQEQLWKNTEKELIGIKIKVKRFNIQNCKNNICKLR